MGVGVEMLDNVNTSSSDKGIIQTLQQQPQQQQQQLNTICSSNSSSNSNNSSPHLYIGYGVGGAPLVAEKRSFSVRPSVKVDWRPSSSYLREKAKKKKTRNAFMYKGV